MGKRSCGPEPAVYQCIVDTFKKTGSVKEASEKSGASANTVQRVLITEGLWSSRTSEKVKKLYDEGLSANEIARQLRMATVMPYMPYGREKEKSDAPAAAGKKKKESGPGQKARTAAGTAAAGTASRPAGRAPAGNRGKKAGPKGKTPDAGTEENAVFKLHLELTGPFYDGAKENLGMGKARFREFLSLAKAEKGISRDILAPGDMTLHALHYAIQRLFGWPNRHRHFFCLPFDQFMQITGSRFMIYSNLCGSVFRFPDGDMADQQWDDDYTGSTSYRSWLRKKYTAPFRHRGSIGDSYVGNRWEIRDLDRKYPDLDDNATFLEVLQTARVSEDFNCLIQHRTLQEMLLPETAERPDLETWLMHFLDSEKELDDVVLSPGAHLGYYEMNAHQLREWRQVTATLEEDYWLDPDGVRKLVQKKENMSYEDYLKGHKDMVKLYAARCRKILYDWDFPVEPYFSEIYYQYEDTENWCIRITPEERRVDEDEYKALKGRPVCVRADGIGLLDDCGGVSGYLDALRTLCGPEPEEDDVTDEMRKWAEDRGWSDKVPDPAKLL